MSNEFTHNTQTVAKIVLARLRFVMVFVVAALLVAYWENIRNHYDKWSRPPAVAMADGHDHAGEIEYYCSMHPQIVRSEPGNCPICSMPLVKRMKGEKQVLPEGTLARVQLSPQRLTLTNIATSVIDMQPLIRQIRAVGVLDYAEPKVAHISARVAGRADELFIRSIGQEVKAGDPVYSLYSPEVYTAQREYLLARRRVNDLTKEKSDALADATAVYNAAMQKLVLWGVSMQELDKMELNYERSGEVPTHFIVTSPISGIVIQKDIDQGHYVVVGEDPYTVADLTTLWLQAKIYEQDLPLVKIGQSVEVSLDALPGESFTGTVGFISFKLDPQTRTADARVLMDNPGFRLRPGMYSTAQINVPIAAAVPTTRSTSTHQADASMHFAEALQSYLKIQQSLAGDKIDGVADTVKEVITRLDPIKAEPNVRGPYDQLVKSTGNLSNGDLAEAREAFQDFSAGMIEIGKVVGLPVDAANIQVFRCPMAKANWLQPAGTTSNPYYGSKMLTCGGPVLLTFPRNSAMPATNPSTQNAGKVIAVPRSAVIDTGAKMIVYVQSNEGVFDMKAVKLGPVAGEFYPVIEGLSEGDIVVKSGAFLLDSENRLNPNK